MIKDKFPIPFKVIPFICVLNSTSNNFSQGYYFCNYVFFFSCSSKFFFPPSAGLCQLVCNITQYDPFKTKSSHNPTFLLVTAPVFHALSWKTPMKELSIFIILSLSLLPILYEVFLPTRPMKNLFSRLQKITSSG